MNAASSALVTRPALAAATALVTSLAATHPLRAQPLNDPMRPAILATPARTTADGNNPSPAGPALLLQSILITTDRRHAWIDNRPVEVGDRIGTLRVARIEEAGVTLVDPSGRRTVLGLHPDVVRATPAAAPGATR